MYAQERQQAMAQLVMARGRVSVSELAQEFSVTSETVRRDLSALERMRLVRRLHGGAVPAASLSVMESGLDERDSSKAREKERIALAAIEHLPPAGGSIAIDAGSTTARLAHFLPRDTHLTAFTHGVPIAARLANLPHIELHLLPGKVRTTTQAAVGSFTVDAISRLHIDVVFLGTNGISLDHGFSTPDPEEAAVKRALVAAARTVVILADTEKFGRAATVNFAALEDVDILITDGEDPTMPHSALAERGITVIVA